MTNDQEFDQFWPCCISVYLIQNGYCRHPPHLLVLSHIWSFHFIFVHVHVCAHISKRVCQCIISVTSFSCIQNKKSNMLLQTAKTVCKMTSQCLYKYWQFFCTRSYCVLVCIFMSEASRCELGNDVSFGINVSAHNSWIKVVVVNLVRFKIDSWSTKLK